MPEDSLYEVLGLDKNATEEEIERAYHKLVKRVHPDVGGNEFLFRRVRHAYETLSDPADRADYDDEQNGKGSADEHAQDPGGPVAQDHPSGGSHVPAAGPVASRAAALLRRHAWMFVMAAAVVITMFSSNYGVIPLLLALIAAQRSRRAARSRALAADGRSWWEVRETNSAR